MRWVVLQWDVETIQAESGVGLNWLLVAHDLCPRTARGRGCARSVVDAQKSASSKYLAFNHVFDGPLV